MTRRATPDLLPGTVDLLILRTLQTEPLHGWAISERIQQISGEVLQINQGSLYPRSIASNTRTGSKRNGRCRSSADGRSTRLTASGRRQLAVETREWERMSAAIGRVMKLA